MLLPLVIRYHPLRWDVLELSEIAHIFFHMFLYRDEDGYISIQREKIEAKLGYTQITPIIIVDP